MFFLFHTFTACFSINCYPFVVEMFVCFSGSRSYFIKGKIMQCKIILVEGDVKVQLKHSCEYNIQAPSNLTCTILGAHLKPFDDLLVAGPPGPVGFPGAVRVRCFVVERTEHSPSWLLGVWMLFIC